MNGKRVFNALNWNSWNFIASKRNKFSQSDKLDRIIIIIVEAGKLRPKTAIKEFLGNWNANGRLLLVFNLR